MGGLGKMLLWVCWRINFKRLNPFNTPRLGSSAYTEDGGSTAGRESSCRVQQSHGLIGGHAGKRQAQGTPRLRGHSSPCHCLLLTKRGSSFTAAAVATTTKRSLKKDASQDNDQSLLEIIKLAPAWPLKFSKKKKKIHMVLVCVVCGCEA